MKKTLSFALAFLLASSCMAFPVHAEYSTDSDIVGKFIVVGKADNNYLVQHYQVYDETLHSSTLIYYRSPEQFSFGDVLTAHGLADIIETIPCEVDFLENGGFEKVGVCEELEFTVTENEIKDFNYFKDISDSWYHRHASEDYYNEYTDFTLTEGETVTFYAYDGIPVLPKLDSSSSETALSKGDINGDGTVNILDAITINKAILGKEVLTAVQNQAADVNEDSQVNAADSLALLKYVVGLIESFDQ